MTRPVNKPGQPVNKSGRGGHRPGSGRPKKSPEELKINSTIRLTPRAAEYLRQNRAAIQAEIEEKASNSFPVPR